MPKPVAHLFVLEALLESPICDRIHVKPMFGSHAVYVDDKIIFILRQRDDARTAGDNGVWVSPDQTMLTIFPDRRF